MYGATKERSSSVMAVVSPNEMRCSQLAANVRNFLRVRGMEYITFLTCGGPGRSLTVLARGIRLRIVRQTSPPLCLCLVKRGQ
jgi:hypothetical protein